MDVPYISFIKRNMNSNSPAENYMIEERLLNDFKGLDKID